MKKFILLLLSLFILTIQAQTYTNPILKPGKYNGKKISTMADPYVFKDTDGTYYMYITSNGYPCFTSRDLVNWEFKGDVLPSKNCKWAVKNFWAPEVIKIKDKYYLHYTASRADDIKHIGVAVSDKPTGPFKDVDDKPFIDNGNKGSIDSHVFVDDDGKTYMYYSNAMSTNPVKELGGKRRSEIWVMEVSPDLSKKLSTPKMLIYPEQAWEFSPSENDYWNEGTVIIKHNNLYYLMFSANCFCGDSYSLGYATSTSPTGPFKKYDKNPILTNQSLPKKVSGPGHHTVVRSPDDKEWFCIYHSHVNVGKLNKKNNGVRQINIDRMEFMSDGSIRIIGPTITPQPYPSCHNIAGQ